MSEARLGERNPMWKDGESGRYGQGWKQTRREIRKRDEVCQACGYDGSSDRLDVHHIIPISHFRIAEDVDIAEGHDASNLILLCIKCHMEAEYGDLHIESGILDPLDG